MSAKKFPEKAIRGLCVAVRKASDPEQSGPPGYRREPLGILADDSMGGFAFPSVRPVSAELINNLLYTANVT